MAEKRYYWLKLPIDFFRQKEIKRLCQIAGGDTYTIIYLKMLLVSIKEGGKLFYDGVADDFTSELALDLDENPDDVTVTVNFLLKAGILVEISASEYEVLTAKEMTGAETASAMRKRRSRAGQCPELAGKCHTNVTNCHTEKEIELEKEFRVIPPIPPKGETAFDRFWKAYPKKVGKKAASKAFEKARKTGVTLETLLSAIDRQKCSDQWSRDNGQYIPNPATWLNQGRWDDELETSAPQGDVDAYTGGLTDAEYHQLLYGEPGEG